MQVDTHVKCESCQKGELFDLCKVCRKLTFESELDIREFIRTWQIDIENHKPSNSIKGFEEKVENTFDVLG